MGLLDATGLSTDVHYAPGGAKAVKLVALYGVTNGSGDITAWNGYSLTDIPVARSGGQYTITLGNYRNILSVQVACSAEASLTITKVGDDQLRLFWGGAITSGYISVIAVLDTETF